MEEDDKERLIRIDERQREVFRRLDKLESGAHIDDVVNPIKKDVEAGKATMWRLIWIMVAWIIGSVLKSIGLGDLIKHIP